MKKVILISLAVIVIFSGGFAVSWAIFRNKEELKDVKTTQTSKVEKPVVKNSEPAKNETINQKTSTNLYDFSGETLNFTNKKQFDILNIDNELKAHLTSLLGNTGNNQCKPVVALSGVYGKYAIGSIGVTGGENCIGGISFIAGVKNGKIENLHTGHFEPTCAEKAAMGLPAEFAKLVNCN